ncbi:bifunctional DNA primase/polymerase [Streptomyces sp. N2-109]|uniref:Bifunctional DNA primase/polymerase n=1 Tax=Streptomyces gossypii TaxID=2883101 RepID=A0ABT2JTI5_9ACTN|nr:bifunctional DNA primase/polymerase [Streptomyces gossypii]MCT2591187.1 bifunctional DNA primase/polymerase [Streptomyces gossypii]
MSDPVGPAANVAPAAPVTPEGADWLASASRFPRSVHALWALRPGAPSVLPCGSVFDVASTPAHQGRALLDCLWSRGRGSGPVAVHRGRLLLFAAPGTADRLPALLRWEEWRSDAEGAAFPPLLCHGLGDAVTVPALIPDASAGEAPPCRLPAGPSRWLVPPGVRHPWLPGPELLLWACVRTLRSSRAGGGGGGGGRTNFHYAGS